MTLPVSSERQLTLQARQSQRQDVQSEAARETSARRFRVLEEAQQHGSRRVFVFSYVSNVGGVAFAGKAGLEVTTAWPTTTCSSTAPEQRPTTTRKTPAGHRQFGCLSPSALPAQSPHVEKNPPPCQLMIPVESLPHWARLSYEKNLKSKTKQVRRLKGGVRPSGCRFFFFFTFRKMVDIFLVFSFKKSFFLCFLFFHLFSFFCLRFHYVFYFWWEEEEGRAASRALRSGSRLVWSSDRFSRIMCYVLCPVSYLSCVSFPPCS